MKTGAKLDRSGNYMVGSWGNLGKSKFLKFRKVLSETCEILQNFKNFSTGVEQNWVELMQFKVSNIVVDARYMTVS